MAEAKEVSAGLLSRAFRTPAPRALSLHNLLDLQPIAEDAAEPAGAAAAPPRGRQQRRPGRARAPPTAARRAAATAAGKAAAGRPAGCLPAPVRRPACRFSASQAMQHRSCAICMSHEAELMPRLLPHVPSCLTTAVFVSVPLCQACIRFYIEACLAVSAYARRCTHTPTHS